MPLDSETRTLLEGIQSQLNNVLNQFNAALALEMQNRVNEQKKTRQMIRDLGWNKTYVQQRGTDPRVGGNKDGDGSDITINTIYEAISNALQSANQYIDIGELVNNTITLTFQFTKAVTDIFNLIQGDDYIQVSYNPVNNKLSLTLDLEMLQEQIETTVINDNSSTSTSQTWSISKIIDYVTNIVAASEVGLLNYAGYISLDQPANPKTGLLFFNSTAGGSPISDMSDGLSQFDGTSWNTVTTGYAPKDWDVWFNANDNSTWYWFADMWHPLNFTIDLGNYVQTSQIEDNSLTISLSDGSKTVTYNPLQGSQDIEIPVGGGGGGGNTPLTMKLNGVQQGSTYTPAGSVEEIDIIFNPGDFGGGNGSGTVDPAAPMGTVVIGLGGPNDEKPAWADFMAVYQNGAYFIDFNWLANAQIAILGKAGSEQNGAINIWNVPLNRVGVLYMATGGGTESPIPNVDMGNRQINVTAQTTQQYGNTVATLMTQNWLGMITFLYGKAAGVNLGTNITGGGYTNL